MFQVKLLVCRPMPILMLSAFLSGGTLVFDRRFDRCPALDYTADG